MFHLSNTTFQVGKLTMFNQLIKLINIMIKDPMKLKLVCVFSLCILIYICNYVCELIFLLQEKKTKNLDDLDHECTCKCLFNKMDSRMKMSLPQIKG